MFKLYAPVPNLLSLLLFYIVLCLLYFSPLLSCYHSTIIPDLNCTLDNFIVIFCATFNILQEIYQNNTSSSPVQFCVLLSLMLYKRFIYPNKCIVHFPIKGFGHIPIPYSLIYVGSPIYRLILILWFSYSQARHILGASLPSNWCLDPSPLSFCPLLSESTFSYSACMENVLISLTFPYDQQMDLH